MTPREAAIYEDCAKLADEYERSQGDDPNGFACACRQLAAAFRARAKEQTGATTMKKPIEEALAELVSDYAKSGGKGRHAIPRRNQRGHAFANPGERGKRGAVAVDKFRDALERIALLDEAAGHELTVRHAFEAVAIATSIFGKHPAEIHADRELRKAQVI